MHMPNAEVFFDGSHQYFGIDHAVEGLLTSQGSGHSCHQVGAGRGCTEDSGHTFGTFADLVSHNHDSMEFACTHFNDHPIESSIMFGHMFSALVCDVFFARTHGAGCCFAHTHDIGCCFARTRGARCHLALQGPMVLDIALHGPIVLDVALQGPMALAGCCFARAHGAGCCIARTHGSGCRFARARCSLVVFPGNGSFHCKRNNVQF
jgi:hypothetical protein